MFQVVDRPGNLSKLAFKKEKTDDRYESVSSELLFENILSDKNIDSSSQRVQFIQNRECSEPPTRLSPRDNMWKVFYFHQTEYVQLSYLKY